jgi:hypothetical protein
MSDTVRHGADRAPHLGWPRGRHDRGGKETSGGDGEAILTAVAFNSGAARKEQER